jgi:hypothetical protein
MRKGSSMEDGEDMVRRKVGETLPPFLSYSSHTLNSPALKPHPYPQQDLRTSYPPPFSGVI